MTSIAAEAEELTMRLLTLALLVLLGIAQTACSAANSPLAPTSPEAETLATHLSFCSDEINRYRASVGRPPLARSQALEQFAAEAAKHDADTRTAHKHFRDTNGAGISRAQTEILWWRDVPVKKVVEGGLAQMWRVGPGGQHYDILAGPYSEVGCGIFVDGNEVTVAQDFR